MIYLILEIYLRSLTYFDICIDFDAVQCAIGKTHLYSSTKCSEERKFIAELSGENQILIACRANIEINDDMQICCNHETRIINKFIFFEKWCCDPFGIHVKNIDNRLEIISLEMADEAKYLLSDLKIRLVPGKKLCHACNLRIKENLKLSKEHEDLNPYSEPLSGQTSTTACSEEVEHEIQLICESLSISPLKKSTRESNNRTEAKRKLQKITEKSKRNITKLLKLREDSEVHIQFDIHKFKNLILELKEKFDSSNYGCKVQILTMFTDIYSVSEIMNIFEVPKSIAYEAAELKKTKGILSIPDPRKGKKLPEDVANRVIAFYSDEAFDHVRILPGKKDCKSIRKNVHVQKRLILCTLRELFKYYKERYPNDNLSFSSFCRLRPKYCVEAGSSGTHSVCVCCKHQNTKLLLNAWAHNNLDYKEIIPKIVCNMNDHDCMLRLCKNCNSLEKLESVLINFVFSSSENLVDYDEEITYQQWTQTDRAELLTLRGTNEELLEIMLKAFHVLIPHHFVSKQQSLYLKERKLNLNKKTALVLVDFSENYSFVIQDEIQSRYWSKSTCTLHPTVIYVRNDDGEVEAKNMCFLTDDLKHDVGMVSKFQDYIIDFIKEKYPKIEEIEYFSDGCAGQYKNCTNFLNLCYHKKM